MKTEMRNANAPVVNALKNIQEKYVPFLHHANYYFVSF